jgi:hypothetical protein
MPFTQKYAVKSISQSFSLCFDCLPQFTLMTGSFSNKILINDIIILVKTESNEIIHTCDKTWIQQ